MSSLYFNKYTEDADLVLPYQNIGDNVVLAYDRKAPSAGTLACARILKDHEDTAFMAIDGLNFGDEWFGLEIDLGHAFKSVKISLKGYPARQVYPKIYFDGGALDMNTLEIGEDVRDLNFSATHMSQSGLPKDAKDLRLSLMVPSSEWFVLGLYGVQITHA